MAALCPQPPTACCIRSEHAQVASRVDFGVPCGLFHQMWHPHPCISSHRRSCCQCATIRGFDRAGTVSVVLFFAGRRSGGCDGMPNVGRLQMLRSESVSLRHIRRTHRNNIEAYRGGNELRWPPIAAGFGCPRICSLDSYVFLLGSAPALDPQDQWITMNRLVNELSYRSVMGRFEHQPHHLISGIACCVRRARGAYDDATSVLLWC